MSAVGTFNTSEVRAADVPASETQHKITFSKPFAAPPGLPSGLNALDVDDGTSVRIKSHIDGISKTGCIVHIDSLDDTKLNSGGISWVDVAPGDLEYQHGEFSWNATVTDPPKAGAPKDVVARRITFPRPFVTLPKVISFFSSLELARDDCHVETAVTNIDHDGFVIHILTWGETILYSAAVGWIAYPGDRPFVFSGLSNTGELHSYKNPTVTNEKSIKFGDVKFWKTPSVFVAFSELSFRHATPFRVRAYVDGVTTTGLTWHVDTWGDSVLLSAKISYLGICDSTVAPP